MPDGGFHKSIKDLARLRQVVARLERGGGPASGGALKTGLAALDGFLPGGGLVLGALHALEGFSAAGFAAVLAARALALKAGPLLWCEAPCRHEGDAGAYLPGLKHFGLSSERLLVLKPKTQAELLWALEEGLKSGALAGLVARLPRGLDLTAGRRLQLAAQAGGTPAFLLLDHRAGLPVAHTRWRVTPVPVFLTPHLASCLAFWHLELLKARGGRPGQWRVMFDDTTHCLDLFSPSQHGPARAA